MKVWAARDQGPRSCGMERHWPRSDAATGWPIACAAGPGAGFCLLGGKPRSAAPAPPIVRRQHRSPSLRRGRTHHVRTGSSSNRP
jgi:hypothetical protein